MPLGNRASVLALLIELQTARTILMVAMSPLLSFSCVKTPLSMTGSSISVPCRTWPVYLLPAVICLRRIGPEVERGIDDPSEGSASSEMLDVSEIWCAFFCAAGTCARTSLLTRRPAETIRSRYIRRARSKLMVATSCSRLSVATLCLW